MAEQYSDITALIHPDAQKHMFDEIARASGNEIFFGGNLNDDGLVAYVEVLARGNETGVPAIIHASLDYDLTIHNHPSGFLRPSEADLDIASELGNASIGSFIVDNDVTHVYVVVPAPKQIKRVPIDIPETLKIFLDDGTLSKILPVYEMRHEQTEMSEAVMHAFNDEAHLIVEAGTGVGKSLAYIIPSIIWLSKNKGRIVISTNTINLQQQIIEKDLPAIVHTLAPELKYMLVKGRNNFVCIRKVKQALHGGNGEQTLDLETMQESFIQEIDDWIEQTVDGSISDLNMKPRNDLWELVQSEADTCTGIKCQHYGECFYYVMKKKIKSSQILVVNHHILCAELSINAETKGQTQFLAKYEKVIIDEAHNFEESASKYFGQEGSKLGIVKNMNLLFRVKRGRRFGWAHTLRRYIEKNADRLHHDDASSLIHDIDTFVDELTHARNVLEQKSKAFLAYCREHIGKSGERSWRFRIDKRLSETRHWTEDGLMLLDDIGAALYALSNAGERVKNNFLDLCLTSTLEDYREPIIRFGNYLDRIKTTTTTLNSVMHYNEDEFIRWFDVRLNRRGVLLFNWNLTPIEVDSYLHTHLFERFESVILTSATLTIDKRFDFFEKRLGLTHIPETKLNRLYLESPYDFKTNARLYIATDCAAPTQTQKFNTDIARYVENSMGLTRGRAFVLFTSFTSLSAVEKLCADELHVLGVNLLTQSGDYQRNALLDMFRSSAHNVLFGVDSFWEGVDVAGKNLEMIIIPKLPFSVPTDPIGSARQEYIEKQGGNAFMEYTIPLAVIKFKQGFGRLIRGSQDRGAVVLLDKRVIEKNYGKKFIASLPPVTALSGTIKEILTDMREFYKNTLSP